MTMIEALCAQTLDQTKQLSSPMLNAIIGAKSSDVGAPYNAGRNNESLNRKSCYSSPESGRHTGEPLTKKYS